VVEAQKPAEPLPAADRSGRVIGCLLNEPTLAALMVALGVVVGDVFSDGCAEVVLAQQHELAEALASDGPHEAFGRCRGMTAAIASLTTGNKPRRPVWNRNGASSSTRYWLKLKPGVPGIDTGVLMR
jgi:hypothetical protein